MRIVMMGTGPFAVPTFEALLESGHQVVALFTQPLRPVRGKRSAPPAPMREVAQRQGLPIFDPANINTSEAQQLLAAQEADLLVVCDYGQILSQETLKLAQHGGINLHGSILPKYRGAAPVNWAIYHGDTETGVTVIHMTPKLDGGPCLKVVRTPIGAHETAVELEKRLAQLGAPAVLEAIDILANHPGGELIGQPQDAEQASKAPRLAKTDAAVHWNHTARQIYNQFRAFQPWPGCYTYLVREGRPPLRLILTQIRVVQPDQEQSAPGTVAEVEPDRLLLAARKGLIQVDRLQPAGKKELASAEFIRGYQPRVGDQLTAEVPAT